MKSGRYALRKARNGGADRYGQFREGKQISPDSIAGRQIWHKFVAGNVSR